MFWRRKGRASHLPDKMHEAPKVYRPMNTAEHRRLDEDTQARIARRHALWMAAMLAIYALAVMMATFAAARGGQ